MKAIYTPAQRRQRLITQCRRWYRDNKDWFNPKRAESKRNRYATDAQFRERIKTEMRNRMRQQ
jgi:hypothetical protein